MTDEAPLSLCWVPSRRREWELRRVVRADGDVVVTEEEGEVRGSRRAHACMLFPAASA